LSAATYPKRLIEVDLPIKEISAHARREKSIRQGHISTLHMWWARRPLAACRAVLCASLWPDPADEHCPQTFRDVAAQTLVEFADTVRTNKELAELCTAHWPKWRAIDSTLLRAEDAATWLAIRQALLDFIADFANWSASGVPAFLKVAQTLTETAHRTLLGPLGPAPLVVDPFAGGGSIPLEALRIGADAFATDLNPIPVLLNRVTLEIAPRNGIRLAAEVRRLAPIMRAAAERKLARFYARGPKGEVPIAYLWARTISCEGPGCGAEIPLLQTFWLARKAGRSVALVVKPGPDRKSLALEVDEHAKGDQVHTPTTQRGSAICPLCGFTTPAKSVRAQLSRLDGGSADARLTAVVWKAGKETVYREPTATDVASVRDAAVALQSVDELLLPSEPTPDNSGHRAVGSPFIYGMRRWRDLYTPRQLLCLTTYVTLVRELPAHTVEQRAVRILLALAMSKMADYASSLSTWRIQRSCVRGTFSRQALGFTWDFGEMNPFGESASDFVEGCEYVAKVVEQVALAVGAHVGGGGTGAALADATRHPLPDDSAAAFITDPPYYDSVPYAEISDFFYVWLKRTLGDQVHDLFGGTLTPKAEQAIVWHPGSQTEADGFLKKMAGAMSEGRRVVHPAGIGVVIFAHKSTSGWEAQLNAMISAGWIINRELAPRYRARWPVQRAGHRFADIIGSHRLPPAGEPRRFSSKRCCRQLALRSRRAAYPDSRLDAPFGE
jgi:adenine-specific DNA methylase